MADSLFKVESVSQLHDLCFLSFLKPKLNKIAQSSSSWVCLAHKKGSQIECQHGRLLRLSQLPISTNLNLINAD